MSSSSSNAPSTPFEWLSGGLFFGNRGGDAGIDSCKDVMSLLRGIDENLESFLQASAEADGAKLEGEGTALPEESPQEQASKLLAARLSRLRFLLYDERRASSRESSRKSTPTVAATTVEGLTGDALGHLMPKLLSHLCALAFESRKHVAAIYNYLLVCGLEGSDAEQYSPIMIRFRDYVAANYDEILAPIVKGYDCGQPGGPTPDVALHCGTMYRSSLRHLSLYQQLVTSTARVQKYVFPLLDKYVLFPNFDVASDAMESLKLVLTGGDDRNVDEDTQQAMAQLASDFLTRDYVAIFDERFNPKLLAPEANYMTRRMALQILSTVLLTRSNYNVMIRYIDSESNLMRIMLLLRDTSPHITLDAFHVFKIFVANPNKPEKIVKILSDNKVKLCAYLETLHKDREATDQQFRDEKALVISTIEAISN